VLGEPERHPAQPIEQVRRGLALVALGVDEVEGEGLTTERSVDMARV
jgi:hypothetical protein